MRLCPWCDWTCSDAMLRSWATCEKRGRSLLPRNGSGRVVLVTRRCRVLGCTPDGGRRWGWRARAGKGRVGWRASLAIVTDELFIRSRSSEFRDDIDLTAPKGGYKTSVIFWFLVFFSSHRPTNRHLSHLSPQISPLVSPSLVSTTSQVKSSSLKTNPHKLTL